MDLEDWRSEINAIDSELVQLLNKRAELAIKIGAIKKAAGLPIYDPDREREVLMRACRANTGPLDDRAIIKLYRRIISESRRIEAQMAETSETHPNGVI
jgi:chorismate mutase